MKRNIKKVIFFLNGKVRFLIRTSPIADPSLYRHTCWKIKERGAVGETILHLCLLNATSLHADIAKRLLRFYPRLINDIYMSDEYYGLKKKIIKFRGH